MLKDQQFNLYQPPLRRDPPPLHPQMMLEICALFVLILMVWGGVNAWRSGSLAQQITAVSQQAAAIQNQLNAISLQRPVSNAAALDRDIQSLQETIKEHRAISDLIQTQNLGNAKGFSDQMTGLARQYERDIALTSFALLDGGQELRMEGLTQKADRVPRYLAKLRTEASFSGVRVGALAIERETPAVSQWIFRVGPETAADGGKP